MNNMEFILRVAEVLDRRNLLDDKTAAALNKYIRDELERQAPVWVPAPKPQISPVPLPVYPKLDGLVVQNGMPGEVRPLADAAKEIYGAGVLNEWLYGEDKAGEGE